MRISDWSSDVCSSDLGATLAGAFVRAGLVDELLLYMAPVLLGGDARPLFAGLGIEQMAQRLQLQLVETRHVGDDLPLLLRPKAAQHAPEVGATPPTALALDRTSVVGGKSVSVPVDLG